MAWVREHATARRHLSIDARGQRLRSPTVTVDEALRALDAAMADPDVAERVAARLALREPCARRYGPNCVIVWDHMLQRAPGWCSTWPGWSWEFTVGLRCGYPAPTGYACHADGRDCGPA